MILVKGMSAMCSSCGHGITFFSRWLHSSCSIAHDNCTLREDEGGFATFNTMYDECGCSNAIPEPNTENYHHCYIKDLENAGFKNAKEIVSITPETVLEWKTELEKIRHGKTPNAL